VSQPKALSLLAELAAELAKSADPAPAVEPVYYDQTDSPLPRDTYLRLVRSGKLVGYKVAGRLLVKRVDMHAFIEAHRVQPTLANEQDNDAIVAAGLKRLGLRRAG
jgi:hypothetical protein